jgi:hypothetical protein
MPDEIEGLSILVGEEGEPVNEVEDLTRRDEGEF